MRGEIVVTEGSLLWRWDSRERVRCVAQVMGRMCGLGRV